MLTFLFSLVALLPMVDEPLLIPGKTEKPNPAGTVLGTISLSPEARKGMSTAIENSDRRSVTLLAQGLKNPGGNIVGVRVFVNKPDADWRTSTKSQHYVASVAFGQGGEDSFVLDVGDTLRVLAGAKLLHLDKPMTVTFVPISGENDKAPMGEPLVVEKVQLIVASR